MIRKVLASVAMAIGGIATLATVAAFFGGFWWGFDLLANYRWQAMWAALLASVVYALSGKSLPTAVFLVATAINVWLIVPAWLGSQPAASGEDTVRITHVDLAGTLDNPADVITWLVEGDADLLLVAGASADVLDAIPATDPSYALLGADPSDSEVAVFARDDWNMATTIDAVGGKISRITVPSGTGVLDVVTAFGAMGTSSAAAHALADRFTTIADVVNSSGNPVAVIGNLGATKWSVVSKELIEATTLRDATEGFGYLSTWPISDLPIVGQWVGIPIDVVYLGPTLTPLDVVVGPDIGADHLPLTIEISPVAVNR